jgi:hypothetical protein
VQVRAKRDAQVHRTGLTWVDHTSEAYSIAQTIALVRRLLDGMASCTLRGCVLCTPHLDCCGICSALSAARCTKLVARCRLGRWGACKLVPLCRKALLHAAVRTRMLTVLFLTITHRRAHFHPHAVTPSRVRQFARTVAHRFAAGAARAPAVWSSWSAPCANPLPTFRSPPPPHPPLTRRAHPVPQSPRTVPPARFGRLNRRVWALLCAGSGLANIVFALPGTYVALAI